MITSIILAAGASGRMGSPKALLKIHDTTFVRHIINTHRRAGLDKIIVVTGAHSVEVGKHLEHVNVDIIINKNFEHGQLSSIITGIEAMQSTLPEGVLIHPVDHPGVLPVTIKTLIMKFNEGNNPIVIPTFEKKRGHPVMFSSRLFDDLLNAPPEVGARFVVRSHENEIAEVEVQDGGIMINVDTPEDYRQLSNNN